MRMCESPPIARPSFILSLLVSSMKIIISYVSFCSIQGQLHDGMRARVVRMDKAASTRNASARNKISARGARSRRYLLRKGDYGNSTELYIYRSIYGCTSADVDIMLADLVHVGEGVPQEGEVGTKKASAKVMREVRGTLYTDDADMRCCGRYQVWQSR